MKVQMNTNTRMNFKELTIKWQETDWVSARQEVWKIQCLIYEATRSNKESEVIRLQETLLNHPGARLLSVRRVAQDSPGKKTAGVDKIQTLSPGERYGLAQSLSVTDKCSAIRRIWVPKPGTEEKRPLGIPTIHDRAVQALVLSAMEPEWEAKFEPNSYGFRIGRKPADALKLIRTILNHGSKWVYDADIERCFDRINHEALLKKLIQPPTHLIHAQIKAWLKAGIIEGYGSPFQKPDYNPMGTPQGGVISPLLANIALHGLENAVKEVIRTEFKKKMSDQTKIIRYADDFLVMAPTEEILNRSIETVKNVLEAAGLSTKAAKTRVLHTLNKADCNDGDNSFKFLGMSIQQVRVGKHKAKKGAGRKKSKNQWVTRMLPHPTKEKLHFKKLNQEIKACTKPMEIIRRVNPMVRGWSSYFKYSDGKTHGRTAWYSKRLFTLISNWQKRRYHTRKRLSKLWKTVEGNNWVFYGYDPKSKKEYTLADYGKHITWSVIQYVQVNSRRSPYDGDWSYWGKRMPNYLGTDSKTGKLIKKQKGLCLECKTLIRFGDPVQIDHVVPRAKGGLEKLSNLQLLHSDCHLKKTMAERIPPTDFE
jgi:RNA-directed DNA polymerase